MTDISLKYYGKTWSEMAMLSEEERQAIYKQAEKDNEMFFELLQIPSDFTWELWQYCKENNITAADLINTHKTNKKND